MAKTNKTTKKSKAKIPKTKRTNMWKNKSELVKKKIAKNSETNNDIILELMTKYSELNQTFEYILYSNKYKHTLTDVFNIIKMLFSKLEELEKHDVDLINTLENINLNNKIKGLIQSTAINLTHVVEQLDINESTFLNFARNFRPLTVKNDNQEVTNSQVSSCASIPIVSEEPIVSSSQGCSDNCLNQTIKTENRSDQLITNIFGGKYTIVLSSDDEYEESEDYNGSKKQNLINSTPIKHEDLESYVIGSDIKDIFDPESSSHEIISPSRQSQEIIPKSKSQLKTPVQKNRKVKPKVSNEAVDEARKADFNLRKRQIVRNNAMLSIVKELNLKPHDIVLEFDIVKKKPIVKVSKELAKVLKVHQVEGIHFLWNTVFETVEKTNTTEGTGCILAHRMGIGKTLQIITIIYTILCHTQINIKTFLIICPPGLIYNWMDEIYKWLKNIDVDEVVKIYDLPKTQKLYNITNIATWKSKGGILILSYENFKSLVNCKQSDLQEAFYHTLVDPGPDVVILDEGHYIKNTQTILLKSLTQIRTKRRIVLTGTPMQNSLKEYHTLVEFVRPNILGNLTDFVTTFIKPIDAGQFIDSCDEDVKIMKQRTFILYKLLQNTVHRIDDKNLKPLFTNKIEYTIEINLTKFQCELYEKFLHYNKTSNDGCNVFLRLHVLTLITLHPLTLYRLKHFKNSKQRELGTTVDEKLSKDLSWIDSYGEDPRFFEAKQSNKITYVLNTIHECSKRNEKVLCFLKSPLALDALEHFLKQEKKWVLGEDYLRMDGKTPLSIRNQMCEAFNNPENTSKVFLLSMGTGVLGYNMVGANRVLLLSTSWNPSNDLQAIYRCLRFGQKKTVYVNRLLAKGTVEPKAYYRQISKLGMASSVVDLQHMSRKVSYDQTNDLFTFDSIKHYNQLLPNSKDPVLNQLIRYNFESISDFKEHDSMLVESVEEQLTIEERKDVWLSFKNKQLPTKSLIKPKPLTKLLNTNELLLKYKTNTKISEDSGSTKNIQPKEPQVPTIHSNESHSSKTHTHLNSAQQSNASTSKRKHSTLTNTAKTVKNSRFFEKSDRVKNVEPIQNQFRSFQHKTFNHHKRHLASHYRAPFSGLLPDIRHQSEPNFKSQSNHNPYSINHTRYPSNQTSTENNILNRSGMSRSVD
ncbi:transcriptional regulator ATRX-like [Myzus persicae]|uniref:transcriptional regulator ATRX-like n=1 Tax=Myzus persicae TaxID=13164 RepID=UPI000B932228|nr:transcriptional regulator ATRX-like [Myzus persicae]XP_022165809.1 transcriptional regulator ATRX-like [Myzus persicae]